MRAQLLLVPGVGFHGRARDHRIADAPGPDGYRYGAVVAQELANEQFPLQAHGHCAVGAGLALPPQLRGRRPILHGQVHLAHDGIHSACGLAGLGPPNGERGARFHDLAMVGQHVPRRRHALQRGQDGVAQLPAVGIRDRGIAYILVPGRQVARCALQEHGGGAAGVPLDRFTHGADEVGRDQGVLEREGGGMAGIVGDGGQASPVVAGDAAHQQGVVGRFSRIVADDKPVPVGKIAIGSQFAPPPVPFEDRGLGVLSRRLRCLDCAREYVLHEARHFVAALPVRLGFRQLRRGVAMRHGKDHALPREIYRRDETREELLPKLRVGEPA